ncbi:MAG: 5'-methylthioadenosine/S-adenosylhomocysteine nucleosidase [Spirochaetales bacterium]|nr:5'-methylthioadenosine/S-adenosylhomocysteine nucleosidase [Spirochaetales bacterium]
MKILIICPLKYEYRKALREFNITEQTSCYDFKAACKKMNDNEIMIVQTGPGKARAGIATVSGIEYFRPDFVLDTGSCGGLNNDISAGTVIISYHCFEYDISGFGLPQIKQKMMEIHSGFNKNIVRIVQNLYNNKREIMIGIQACGEYIIKENKDKMLLRKLFDADACNWESAGVFLGALNRKKPCLSIRAVSDMADENTFLDYKKNISGVLSGLYSLIKDFIDKGTFREFLQLWDREAIQINY